MIRLGPVKSREAQIATLVSSICRDLSHKAAQQQSKLLLDQLWLLGDEATKAARRRGEEERERVAVREQRAQDVCLWQGQALTKHGFGIISLISVPSDILWYI